MDILIGISCLSIVMWFFVILNAMKDIGDGFDDFIPIWFALSFVTIMALAGVYFLFVK